MFRNSLLMVIFLCFSWETQDTEIIDLNFYYNSEESVDLTFNLLLDISPQYQYFSFTNLVDNNADLDLNTYYSQQHFRFKPFQDIPLQLSHMFTFAGGDNNDNTRYGIRWIVSETKAFKEFFNMLNLTYTFNPNIFTYRTYRSPEYFGQIEHFYMLHLFNRRVLISGFADQNILCEEKKFTWVTEHQIAFRTYNILCFVFEYRYNDFQKVKNQFALGFEIRKIS